jgi:hypothetical protein
MEGEHSNHHETADRYDRVMEGGMRLKQMLMHAERLSISLLMVLVLWVHAQSAAAASDTLLQSSDMIYEGAFRLPAGSFGPLPYANFEYGGNALAYNPANNSLYIVSHAYSQLTAEISIPQIVSSTTLSSLRTATLQQSFSDGLEGRLNSINPQDMSAAGGNMIGGQMVYNGKLYLTAYTYFDAGFTQTTSHFSRALRLATSGQVTGPVKVGTVIPGFVAGYMAAIPPEWQSSLGATALTGQCCLPIITRTSFGPAAFAFNPENIGSQNPVSATPLVYYPSEHPTLGTWRTGGGIGLYNGVMEIGGVVFPVNTRSVLFIGSTGDDFCYGVGTTDPSLHHVPIETDLEYCYDPTHSDKGVHGYPYRYEVYAYDVNDLIAAKNGQKQAWEVVPYAHWSLNLPFRNDNNLIRIKGVAYDPATQRIFLSQQYSDGAMPLIQVYRINVQNQSSGNLSVCGNSVCESPENCTTCATDCGSCPIQCLPAEIAPCNGCIDAAELSTYIAQWKTSSTITMKQLIDAIALWKGGCSNG